MALQVLTVVAVALGGVALCLWLAYRVAAGAARAFLVAVGFKEDDR